VTSELSDTLLGLRWPLPRTDNDARAALDQLAQVSGRLTDLADQYRALAPGWLGPVQALIAQGGFTLDWWQPLLAEPDLDWTINHQAHLAADLAQIAAAGARILDQLSPTGSPAAPSPVVKSVASFGSVPMSAAVIPPVVPSNPPPAPTGAPLLPSSVPPAPRNPAPPRPNQANQAQGHPGQPHPNQSHPGQPHPGQPRSGQPQPRPAQFGPDGSGPDEFGPDKFGTAQSDEDAVDPLADSGRHRRAAYEFGPPRSTWRSAVQDRFPSHVVRPYSDDDEDDDTLLSSDRRLPAHAGMLVQAAIVLCVVGGLSWWAVTELHGSSPVQAPAADGASSHPASLNPTAGLTPTAAAGLGIPASPSPSATPSPHATTAPASTRGAAPGSATVSDLSVSLLGGSQSVKQIAVYLTFDASGDGSVTVTIDYYGSSGGHEVSPETASWTESGHTSYQLAESIPASAYCGATVTVVASSGSDSSSAVTDPGC
jgi:hypothetical protein